MEKKMKRTIYVLPVKKHSPYQSVSECFFWSSVRLTVDIISTLPIVDGQIPHIFWTHDGEKQDNINEISDPGED
jgi:hypothetical protein